MKIFFFFFFLLTPKKRLNPCVNDKKKEIKNIFFEKSEYIDFVYDMFFDFSIFIYFNKPFHSCIFSIQNMFDVSHLPDIP